MPQSSPRCGVQKELLDGEDIFQKANASFLQDFFSPPHSSSLSFFPYFSFLSQSVGTHRWPPWKKEPYLSELCFLPTLSPGLMGSAGEGGMQPRLEERCTRPVA